MNCNTFWKARLCYNGVSITSGRMFVWNQAFLRLYTAVELPNAFTVFLCWRKTLVAWDHHQSQYLIQSGVTKVSFAAPFLFWPIHKLFCSFEENYVGLIKCSNLLVAQCPIKEMCRCDVKWWGDAVVKNTNQGDGYYLYPKEVIWDSVILFIVIVVHQMVTMQKSFPWP